MTIQEVLNLGGYFTWDFGQKFFIETHKGNFIWSDPDYSGDNSITPTNLGYGEWSQGSYGRAKGYHIIGSYVDDGAFLKD